MGTGKTGLLRRRDLLNLDKAWIDHKLRFHQLKVKVNSNFRKTNKLKKPFLFPQAHPCTPPVRTQGRKCGNGSWRFRKSQYDFLSTSPNHFKNPSSTICPMPVTSSDLCLNQRINGQIKNAEPRFNHSDLQQYCRWGRRHTINWFHNEDMRRKCANI